MVAGDANVCYLWTGLVVWLEEVKLAVVIVIIIIHSIKTPNTTWIIQPNTWRLLIDRNRTFACVCVSERLPTIRYAYYNKDSRFTSKQDSAQHGQRYQGNYGNRRRSILVLGISNKIEMLMMISWKISGFFLTFDWGEKISFTCESSSQFRFQFIPGSIKLNVVLFLYIPYW